MTAPKAPKPAVAGGPSGDPPVIGGYFGLELPAGSGLPQAGLLRFQSARAALAALLLARRPDRLWLPRLACDSLVSAAAHAGVPVAFYALDADTGTPAGVRLARGELLLAIDLFGLGTAQTEAVLRDHPPDQVVVDHAQSLFSPPPPEALATVYSPRKFVGVPDGGLLATRLAVDEPAEADNGSLGRMAHLLKRFAGQPETGYADFQAAEASLDDCTPRRMSTLTDRLLGSIDFVAVRAARQVNFRALHERLADENGWPFPFPSGATPLCYPFLRARPRDDGRMRQARVYVPTYWPEARERCPAGSFERTLLDRLLPLPVDQRYMVGPPFMLRLAEAGVP